MARIRTIKPEFPQSETTGKLSRDARLLYILIWTIADDSGRARAASRMLASLLYPYDDDAPGLIGTWLDELERGGCIRRYEVEGSTYLEVLNWLKHQKIDRPSPSRLPPFTESSPKHRGRSPKPRESSRGLDADLGSGTVDPGVRTKDHSDDDGVVTRAAPSKEIPGENALLAGPLCKKFSEVYRGPISEAAERRFRALVAAGENADPIIAAAPHANPEMPAEQWLEGRAWTQLSSLPAPAPKVPINNDAKALADELAVIAGQDLKFLESGWCGAAYRCQQWLSNGWPRELIVAGVRSMVAAKYPEKINNVNYFDKGLARFIAQHQRPVPKVGATAESLPRRNSDPIWLQDDFLRTGHDANTRSGTATFVKRKGTHYACTCRHIMESIKDPRVVPNAKFPTLTLAIGKLFINLTRMTANGPELIMRAPGTDTEHSKTDIAIAPLDAGTWHLLATKKNKSAIDLDRWREPDWSTVRFGLAYGYPDEHKKAVSANGVDRVANQLINVVAEVASTPAKANRTITLNSALANPHSWYFSGLSGGPLYFAEGFRRTAGRRRRFVPGRHCFRGIPQQWPYRGAGGARCVGCISHR